MDCGVETAAGTFYLKTHLLKHTYQHDTGCFWYYPKLKKT